MDGDTDTVPVQEDFKNVVKQHIEYMLNNIQEAETHHNGHIPNHNGHIPNGTFKNVLKKITSHKNKNWNQVTRLTETPPCTIWNQSAASVPTWLTVIWPMAMRLVRCWLIIWRITFNHECRFHVHDVGNSLAVISDDTWPGTVFDNSDFYSMDISNNLIIFFFNYCC